MQVLEEEPAWERASLDPASAHLAASNKATGSKGESVLRPAVAGKAAGKLFSAMAGGVSKLGKSVSVFSGSTSKGLLRTTIDMLTSTTNNLHFTFYYITTAGNTNYYPNPY